jgi:hypothetical protein
MHPAGKTVIFVPSKHARLGSLLPVKKKRGLALPKKALNQRQVSRSSGSLTVERLVLSNPRQTGTNSRAHPACNRVKLEPNGTAARRENRRGGHGQKLKTSNEP